MAETIDLLDKESADDVRALPELVGFVLRCWREAKDAKQAVDKRMLDAVRQRDGSYPEDKLQKIRALGMSEVFLRITNMKCRGAIAAIREVFLPMDDKPWMLEATPLPDLPPELDAAIAQWAWSQNLQGVELDDFRELVHTRLLDDAAERAHRMERVCEDQQVEGGFRAALKALVDDVVTKGTGILKAPVIRQRARLAWGRGYQLKVKDELVMEFERVDPFCFYPAPKATDCQSASYVIEHHRLMPADLTSMLGLEGFRDEAIREALKEHQSNCLGNWLNTESDVREVLRNVADDSAAVAEIDVLEFNGLVYGQWLTEYGLDLTDKQNDEYHEATIWLIGDHIIKAVLNEHPLRLRPYYHTNYSRRTGEFWGDGVPTLMEDSQDVVNASARNLINNMGMASGPQVALDSSRTMPGEDYTKMYPWKVWRFKPSENGLASAPINFFQPSSNAGELVNVMDRFMHYAGETSGVSAALHGSASRMGAAATASGQSMLLSRDMAMMKDAVVNIDADIIEPMLHAQFVWNMLYHPDDSIKGDVIIKPRGAVAMIIKEQLQVRRGEFLQSTSNPVDMQIIGMEGRAALLRELAKGLDMPVSKIIPSEEELSRRMQSQMQPPQQNPNPQAAALAPDGSLAGGVESNLM